MVEVICAFEVRFALVGWCFGVVVDPRLAGLVFDVISIDRKF